MPQPRYQDSTCCDVDNLACARDWFSASDPRERWRRVATLSRNNGAHLEALYGPRHQRWTGSERFDVWRVEHGGLTFWLLANREKGTCIEVECATPPWDGWPETAERAVASFLDTLYAALKEREAPWEPPAGDGGGPSPG